MAVINNDIRIFLFDFDGVIRIWQEENTALIEKKYKLKTGAIGEAAFTNELLSNVTTGKLKRHEWIKIIGTKINNLEAAIEWANRPVYIDDGIIQIIQELRSRGYQVCLLTNGTDNLYSELRDLGVDQEFTRVFNSAEMGVAKPSPMIYQIVINRCSLKPENIAFIDDSLDNILAAQILGIKSFHYKGINALRSWLKNDLEVIEK